MDEAKEIIRIVSELRNSTPLLDFSGFGLVTYQGSVDEFPITPLLSDSRLPIPISDSIEMANYLLSISRYSNIRHDGFHFANDKAGLTDIAQFFSPPIPQGYQPKKFGIGARYRSAELGSLIKNVISIVIFGRDGSVAMFKNGIEISI